LQSDTRSAKFVSSFDSTVLFSVFGVSLMLGRITRFYSLNKA
jgi:hypothetical protein